MPGAPYAGEGSSEIHPFIFFGVANGRLQPQGFLHRLTPSGPQKTTVPVRRVDYVGGQGNLILRIVPGAPVPAPSDAVRQIRVCYVDPNPRPRRGHTLVRR